MTHSKLESTSSAAQQTINYCDCHLLAALSNVLLFTLFTCLCVGSLAEKMPHTHTHTPPLSHYLHNELLLLLNYQRGLVWARGKRGGGNKRELFSLLFSSCCCVVVVVVSAGPQLKHSARKWRRDRYVWTARRIRA